MQYVDEHTNFRKKAMFMPFLQGRTDRTWRTLTVESCPASASTVSSCVFFLQWKQDCWLRFVTPLDHPQYTMCIIWFIIIWASTSPSLTSADPPSYLVELLTCKSWVKIAALTSLTYKFVKATVCWAMPWWPAMRRNSPRFNERSRNPSRAARAQDVLGLMRLECFKRFQSDFRNICIYVYIWNVEKKWGVIWIIHDYMSLCHIRTPGSLEICCGKAQGDWVEAVRGEDAIVLEVGCGAYAPFARLCADEGATQVFAIEGNTWAAARAARLTDEKVQVTREGSANADLRWW